MFEIELEKKRMSRFEDSKVGKMELLQVFLKIDILSNLRNVKPTGCSLLFHAGPDWA